MKVKDVQHGKTTRKSFARIEEILEMPNLIEVQEEVLRMVPRSGPA